MTALRSRLQRSSQGESGFSLVEMLVAIMLFSVAMGAVYSLVGSTRSATLKSKQANDINEEARLALNRISRELRQASEITAASAPNGSTSVSFNVDFNGNGVIDSSSLDPEVLTYSYDSSTRQILLTANDPSGTPVTRPILAGNVTAFCLDYHSSKYAYQGVGSQTTTCGQSVSGTTTWQNLDTSAVSAGYGNNNGVLDGPELRAIDAVVLNVTVLQGSNAQVYRTQVELRNRV